MDDDLGPILKAAHPQVVATLIRVLGNIDAAMDASQDALVKALQRWQVEGVPDNPVAWLVTVARNGAIDRIRRERQAVSLESNVVQLSSRLATTIDEEMDLSDIEDDMLRLVFTCCHPALPVPSQTALVLKVVLGFSVEEIARALLVSTAAAEKRLTRAKQQLREEKIAYEIPSAQQLPERLDAVCHATYLLFNQGYSHVHDNLVSNSRLIDEAIRLARMTARLFRRDPEPRALLALLLLSAARLPARLDTHGVFVPLHEQDRSLWDAAMISEGVATIDAVYAARHPPGSYQLQAAISAIHSQAQTAADTDWPQIGALYDKLLTIEDSPVVALNRAVALTFCSRIDEAAAAIEQLRGVAQFKDYQPWFAGLAHVEKVLGNLAAARDAYAQAIELAPSAAHRKYLEQQLALIS